LAANTSIDLIGLDFDGLKQSLKTYFKTDPLGLFKDYDYDGATLSVLLDVLADNSNKNTFLLNMIASEAFLDSAQLRSSVLSRAKELNYLARSSRSAVATITISVVQTGQNFLVIPKGSSFTATVNGQSFTFYTAETQICYAKSQVGNDYYFVSDPINIYEGQYVTDTYIFSSSVPQRFVCSNPSIDTTSLTVNSIEDSGASIVTYMSATSLLGLDSNSLNYFIQANERSLYEVIFGDGVIGRTPQNASVITLQYRAASGIIANGASVFTADEDLTSDNSGRVTVATITSAVGGTDPESLDSVRYNAPRHFQTQERAISSDDYEQLLKEAFPEINAISVYGGENVVPPAFGKVFIAVDIANIDGLPDSKKIEYYNFLKPRMSLPITPEFVAPTFLYWAPTTLIKYNVNLSTMTPNEIEVLVANEISNYNTAYLNNFKKKLRYSKLTTNIDDVTSSIVSNETKVLVYKKIRPLINVGQNITVNFGIALADSVPLLGTTHPAKDVHVVSSSPFTYNNDTALLEDDGDGTVRIIKNVGDQHVTIKNIGTIDYNTGILTLVNFNINAYEGDAINIYVDAATLDIEPSNSDIFTLENNAIVVNVEAVRE
jgi:hypothetical protein